MEQIVIFLFGTLVVLPTCLLARRGREPQTFHVHHWHHEAPQNPQERPQTCYQVITGNDRAHVLDNATGERYAIMQPVYKVGDYNEQ
jgi:hypothetical protein